MPDSKYSNGVGEVMEPVFPNWAVKVKQGVHFFVPAPDAHYRVEKQPMPRGVKWIFRDGLNRVLMTCSAPDTDGMEEFLTLVCQNFYRGL